MAPMSSSSSHRDDDAALLFAYRGASATRRPPPPPSRSRPRPPLLQRKAAAPRAVAAIRFPPASRTTGSWRRAENRAVQQSAAGLVRARFGVRATFPGALGGVRRDPFFGSAGYVVTVDAALRRRHSRRSALAALAGGASLIVSSRAWAQSAQPSAGFDATFVFTNDVHACRMGDGLSPNCAQEGKTDANLLRHIAGINNVPAHVWPEEIGGGADRAGRCRDPDSHAARRRDRRGYDR